MPNGARNNTELPERASTQAVKTVPSKQSCYQIGPWVTFNSRSGPLRRLSRRPLKKLPKRAHNTHLPEQALRKLSRRTTPKRNCCQTSQQSSTINIQLPGRVITTGTGPTEAYHQDGPLPKRNRCRNGSTTLSERASVEAVKTDPFQNETAVKTGRRTA